MSRNHGHGESLFHHIKNYPWSSLKISLAEEPEDCEEDILSITVKQQTQILETLTSTEHIPTENFQTEYWIDILGGVRVYTATD